MANFSVFNGRWAPGPDASAECRTPTRRWEEGRSRGGGRAPGPEASAGSGTPTPALGGRPLAGQWPR